MKRFSLIFIFLSLFVHVGHAQQPTDTLLIDEVVVTGARIEVLRNSMPINISVLQGDELNEVEESAVLPVISRKIPGLFVTERGVTGFGVGTSSAGQITVRGVGAAPNTQVLMLLDGQPQYMGIFGHPLPNSYVSSELERVEVIRGPASLLYGSNAMGGVINMISKKQKADGFSGNARMAYGSFNTSKMMLTSGFRHKGFHLFASLNRDRTDGHRDNSEFEINNAYLKTGYTINPYLEIMADYTIASFNNVDPGRDFAAEEPFEADIVRGKTSLSIKNHYDKLQGGLTAFYNFGDHELSDGWKSRDENMSVSLYQGIALPYNSLLTLGADFKQLGGRGNSGMAANAWNTVHENGTYAILRHELFDIWNVSYGLRLENNSAYGTELVPQAGVSWRALDATTLKASVAKGFRSPTLMETYLFLPNPNLKPERMMSYELGLSQKMLKGKLLADLSIFLLEGSNIIQVVPNPTPPPPMQRVNAGEFSNTGFELELSYFHSAALSADLSYSYLNTETPILAAPEHQLYAGVNYRWNTLRMAIQSQYVGGLYSYLHNPQQMQTPANDLTEDYLLVNASLAWKLLPFAELFVSGKNLLDQTYQINHGYPMPGIHFMSGINVSF